MALKLLLIVLLHLMMYLLICAVESLFGETMLDVIIPCCAYLFFVAGLAFICRQEMSLVKQQKRQSEFILKKNKSQDIFR